VPYLSLSESQKSLKEKSADYVSRGFDFPFVLIDKPRFNRALGEVLRRMGKRKVKSESNLENMLLPSENDVLGTAIKLLGSDRVMVKCQDGKERLCRVRGKLKRRVWVREGDIVLVSPWDFQSDKRGDIFWRYRKNQAEWLKIKGYFQRDERGEYY
jgi:translation initiation factor 1A